MDIVQLKQWYQFVMRKIICLSFAKFYLNILFFSHYINLKYCDIILLQENLKIYINERYRVVKMYGN